MDSTDDKKTDLGDAPKVDAPTDPTADTTDTPAVTMPSSTEPPITTPAGGVGPTDTAGGLKAEEPVAPKVEPAEPAVGGGVAVTPDPAPVAGAATPSTTDVAGDSDDTTST